jgi:hypothetical protein
MISKGLFFTFFAYLTLAPASAQLAETAQPNDDSQPEAERMIAERLDEAVAFFLLDSLSVRNKLRVHGDEALADSYWKSASTFVELVRAADSDLTPQFMPILDGFSRSLREIAIEPANIDLERMEGIRGALDDQNDIYQAPGAFEGDRSMIAVEVRALRADGQPYSGLYVWLDLAGAVPKGASANSLPSVTSPARGTVGPGKYLVRLMRPGTASNAKPTEVGRRPDMRIGRDGNQQTIDVVVNYDEY